MGTCSYCLPKHHQSCSWQITVLCFVFWTALSRCIYKFEFLLSVYVYICFRVILGLGGLWIWRAKECWNEGIKLNTGRRKQACLLMLEKSEFNKKVWEQDIPVYATVIISNAPCYVLFVLLNYHHWLLEYSLLLAFKDCCLGLFGFLLALGILI